MTTYRTDNAATKTWEVESKDGSFNLDTISAPHWIYASHPGYREASVWISGFPHEDLAFETTMVAEGEKTAPITKSIRNADILVISDKSVALYRDLVRDRDVQSLQGKAHAYVATLENPLDRILAKAELNAYLDQLQPFQITAEEFDRIRKHPRYLAASLELLFALARHLHPGDPEKMRTFVQGYEDRIVPGWQVNVNSRLFAEYSATRDWTGAKRLLKHAITQSEGSDYATHFEADLVALSWLGKEWPKNVKIGVDDRTIVYLFNAWCPACGLKIRKMESMDDAFKKAGITLRIAAVDLTAEGVDRYVKKIKTGLPILPMKGLGLDKRFGVSVRKFFFVENGKVSEVHDAYSADSFLSRVTNGPAGANQPVR
ncbi:hypothetical protein [Sulfidibacter corallicola]|uniref:Thioredoxin domain-containing protein n=1 Tax=Sulfidibacter corallicola TaxID=2818388 RepID=A0A8A4TPP0_SULCO|nr:hypothetical protein [Sulfidibacter corallicola]QTD51939.1 hypothetical protein J3U87_05655 [Sulfidibacter corallicola]